MARFGRKETFIAPHYAHSFPTAPVGFHPLQPLNWGPYIPYGTGAPYGGVISTILRNRYTRTELQSRGANVSTYDHYDAIQSVLKAKTKYGNLDAYPQASSFTGAVASNDAAALLKTAYFLAVAATAAGSQTLLQAAKSRAESGSKAGVDVGAASRSNNITATYESAYKLVDGVNKQQPNPVLGEVLEQLKKGTSSWAVSSRVREAQEQGGERAKKEQEPQKETPCSDTLLGKIPGYCESKMIYQVVGYTAAGLIAIWGIKKAVKIARGNPIYALRTNPSSAANMGGEPELDIALTPKGRDQEKRLSNGAFKRTRSK
jgi:hypothetical protein